jgi:RNA polymerase sigma factor (sigma-70 family)
MIRARRTAVGRDLDRLFRLGAHGSVSDPQLLEIFIGGNDESAALAFEAIVDRHGPMVLRACRMVLGDLHAAEDAFQATFLVLARRARTLGSRELLGNWLYGVAIRIARKARRVASKQRARERECVAGREVAVDDARREGIEGDLYRIVHEEINRLPSAYRCAVVVCYLQGQSHAQAASQLNVSETTIRGRLARARKLLGRRLTLRGVAPAAVLFILESVNACAQDIPRATVHATVSSVFHFLNRTTATHGASSVLARSLAKGEFSLMLFHQVKTAAAAIVVVGMLVTAGVLLAQPVARAHPQTKASGDEQRATVDAELAKLVSDRIIRAVPVSKDCMILSYMPTWDHGEVDNIGLGNNDGGNRALLEWPDLPATEAGAADYQFLIALYSRKTIHHPRPGSIQAFEITQDWPERVSWQTKPRYDPDPIGTFEFKPGTGWKVFDITPLVRAQSKAGRKGHGVLLRFLSEDFPSGSAEFDSHSDYKCVSREGTGEWENRRPLLLVVKAAKP